MMRIVNAEINLSSQRIMAAGGIKFMTEDWMIDRQQSIKNSTSSTKKKRAHDRH